MKVTRQLAASKLTAFLQHEVTLAELVGWAEDALMDGEFPELEDRNLRDAIARIGLADVRSFGLAWEDCEQLLLSLGYRARIEVAAA